jgi:hypothetical protein
MMEQQCFAIWELAVMAALFLVFAIAAIRAPRARDRDLWQAIAKSQQRELEFFREIERRRDAAASKTTAVHAVALAILGVLAPAVEDYELARRAANAAIRAFLGMGGPHEPTHR